MSRKQSFLRLAYEKRSETFKLSTDPQFVEKVRDIVGLYLNPPERALVLCVDEKTQIQALHLWEMINPNSYSSENRNPRRNVCMNTKSRNASFPKAAFINVLLLLLVSTLNAQGPPDESRAGQWRMAGQNLSNTWSQPAEHSISPSNVKRLRPKWVFTTGGDVSATPTIEGDAVYFPDWGGNLFAVKNDSGRLIWSHKISEYDGVTGAISRVSPAIDHDQVIIGDILSSNQVHNGANVISVDRETGAPRWITQVETHPAAIITGSPVVFNGVVYIVVSSTEEFLATNPAYPCCSFRGSVVALDAKSGAMLWKTFDLPDNNGQTNQYSGGAIWQPPAIDPRRGTLFIGTGNNYMFLQM